MGRYKVIQDMDDALTTNDNKDKHRSMVTEEIQSLKDRRKTQERTSSYREDNPTEAQSKRGKSQKKKKKKKKKHNSELISAIKTLSGDEQYAFKDRKEKKKRKRENLVSSELSGDIEKSRRNEHRESKDRRQRKRRKQNEGEDSVGADLRGGNDTPLGDVHGESDDGRENERAADEILNPPGGVDFEKSDIEDIELLIHPQTGGASIKKSIALTKYLLELGIKLRTGKWSHVENERLKYNFEKYVTDHEVEEPNQLLSSKLYENRVQFIRNLHLNKFYQKLARGILRTTYSCYKRARALFHTGNSSKLNPDEVKELVRLREVHGNKWARIGISLDKYGQSLNDYWMYHMEYADRDKGFSGWTREEQSQLIQSLQDVLGISDLDGLYSNLPWERIAENVPTRTPRQCRYQWLNTLSFLNAHNFNGSLSWTTKDKIKLITLIYEMDIEAECDIEWDELFNQFEGVASPSTLQIRWYQLKTTIPNFQFKTFDATCEYLFTHKIPQLEKHKESTVKQRDELRITSQEFIDTDNDSD